MGSSEPNPTAAHDVRRAWKALRHLRDRAALPPEPPSDIDGMTDLLFDHALQFETSRLLYLLTNLQIDRLDLLAQELCSARALILDAGMLAEETLCVLFQDSLDGQRKRPFEAWARSALGRAADAAILRPDLAPPRGASASPREQRLAREIASIANQLDEGARRILWHHVVENRSAQWVADHFGLPFEHVEFVLTRALDGARQAVERQDARAPRQRRSSHRDRGQETD